MTGDDRFSLKWTVLLTQTTAFNMSKVTDWYDVQPHFSDIIMACNMHMMFMCNDLAIKVFF